MPNETIGRTMGVAASVCVACSVVVSTAAVSLRPIQLRNETMERKRNVLMAAGLLEKGESADVDALFEKIEPRVYDLVEDRFDDDVDPESVDLSQKVRDPSRQIDVDDPKLGLKHLSRYQVVYLKKTDGRIDRVVLPVVGKGLWSTMYGFLALDGDMKTIESMSFYQHGETPGLGGEVDNPKWKQSWVGKKAYGDGWEPAIDVVKGRAPPDAPHEVDGLSGATLTARGVENLVQFWLGDQGYEPILKKLAQGA
jgi:Na+-transporting NADH:ubiquinone oxidoreductase subunit C